MSANLVKAHGGSKNLLGSSGQIVSGGIFVQDTKAGTHKSASDSHLGHLIANTTGNLSGKPVMDGVLTDTKQGAKDKDIPEIHKISNKGKTQAKRLGQVPFSGPKY